MWKRAGLGTRQTLNMQKAMLAMICLVGDKEDPARGMPPSLKLALCVL